jgi:hypothetical protein
MRRGRICPMRVPGHRWLPADVYAAADTVLFPEPCGLVPLEAMSVGRRGQPHRRLLEEEAARVPARA